MTLRECYETLGGDYDEVFARLRKEELVWKFAVMFLSDPNFDTLCMALASGDREEAFRSVHTLKGVSQNLGFSRLYESSKNLTEHLRGRTEWSGFDEQLFDCVKKDYCRTVNAIRAMQAKREL
ncbi:MAG: Hpt domain-containing protein [Oscillospiraceae bacterium]|nr:Hpt domain-containing protein [Oscillospiraceae bacterium]